MIWKLDRYIVTCPAIFYVRGMHIHVRLYATLSRYLPGLSAGRTAEIELADNATILDLVDKLELPAGGVKVVFVNGRTRSPDWILKPGDEVGIFPPVGGG
jgi:molybdopterin synthase sulfur carrier subunit